VTLSHRKLLQGHYTNVIGHMLTDMSL